REAHVGVPDVALGIAVAVERLRVAERLERHEGLKAAVRSEPAGAERAPHVVARDRHRRVERRVRAERLDALVDQLARDRRRVREEEDEELDRLAPPRELFLDEAIAVDERVLALRLSRAE